MTVRMPETTMDSELIAPSTSPISMALEVPMACEAVPIAIPLAILLRMANSYSAASHMILPNTPVMIIAVTVMAT